MVQISTPREGPPVSHQQTGSALIRPFLLRWHGTDYAIQNVRDHRTQHRNGHTTHIFTATDAMGTFELTFSEQDMAWFLGL